MNDPALQKCIDEWHEAMAQTEYFSLDKTTPDKIHELWDRLAPEFDSALGGDVKRVDKTIEILTKMSAINDNTVAIDIGCGTGTFVLELAKRCRKVYALDISPKMLNKLEQKAKHHGISNIVSICGDWKNLDLTSFDPEINLTLSCLNTGINNFESLDKMTRLSKGWNCYMTVSGKAQIQSRNELQQIVFGRTLKSAYGNDIIFPFNIIYHMGYKPELRYVPCNWCRAVDKATAVTAAVEDFSRFKNIDTETRQKITQYVDTEANEEGLYVQSASIMLGLMAWQS